MQPLSVAGTSIVEREDIKVFSFVSERRHGRSARVSAIAVLAAGHHTICVPS